MEKKEQNIIPVIFEKDNLKRASGHLYFATCAEDNSETTFLQDAHNYSPTTDDTVKYIDSENVKHLLTLNKVDGRENKARYYDQNNKKHAPKMACLNAYNMKSLNDSNVHFIDRSQIYTSPKTSETAAMEDFGNMVQFPMRRTCNTGVCVDNFAPNDIFSLSPSCTFKSPDAELSNACNVRGQNRITAYTHCKEKNVFKMEGITLHDRSSSLVLPKPTTFAGHSKSNLGLVLLQEDFTSKSATDEASEVMVSRDSFMCQICKKEFGSRSALAKHRLIHSKERKYACKECSKSFKRQDHLNGHMLTHMTHKPFQCKVPGCAKSYCDSRSLKRHIESQHQPFLIELIRGNMEIRKFLPPIDSVYMKSAGGGEHRISLSENSQCSEIVDLFLEFSGGNSRNSLFSFEEPKPVTCFICKKRFKNMYALYGHMRLHGGYSKVRDILKSSNCSIKVESEFGNQDTSKMDELNESNRTYNILLKELNFDRLSLDSSSNLNSLSMPSSITFNSNEVSLAKSNENFNIQTEQSSTRLNISTNEGFADKIHSKKMFHDNKVNYQKESFSTVSYKDTKNVVYDCPLFTSSSIKMNESCSIDTFGHVFVYPSSSVSSDPNDDSKNECFQSKDLQMNNVFSEDFSPSDYKNDCIFDLELYSSSSKSSEENFYSFGKAAVDYYQQSDYSESFTNDSVQSEQQQSSSSSTNNEEKADNFLSFVLPANANTIKWWSQLRSPVLPAAQNPSNIAYTPPPILAPNRRASGLYCNIQPLLAERHALLSECSVDDFVLDQPPPTNFYPHVNIGSEYQALIPELDRSSYDSDVTREDLLWDPKCLTYSNLSEDTVSKYLDFAQSSLVAGPFHCELALYVLNMFNGELHQASMALISGVIEVSENMTTVIDKYHFTDDVMWEEAEIEMFSKLLIEYEKDFFKIALKLGTKTEKECIEFYYLFKQVNGDRKKKLKRSGCKNIIRSLNYENNTNSVQTQNP